MGSERDPPRLLDDPSADPELQADLRYATETWEHSVDVEAAIARFGAGASAVSAGEKLSWLWWWGGGGVAAIAISVAGVMYATNASEPARPRAARERAVRIARPLEAVAMEEPAPAPVEPAPVRIEEPARVRTRRVSPRAEPALAPQAERSAYLARLERETALMNEERREAQSGDPRRALSIARQANAEFPDGQFVVEREAWAILALDRLGSRAEVRARAQRFIDRHPRSPQAEMVRGLLERP